MGAAGSAVLVLSLGLAEATSEVFDAGLHLTVPFVAAEANAEALDAEPLVFLLSSVAQASGEALKAEAQVFGTVQPELGIAEGLAQGLLANITGINSVFRDLGLAEASAEGQDIVILVRLLPSIAEASAAGLKAEALAFGEVDIQAGIAEAVAQALDGDAQYYIDRAPQIRVTRTGTTATVEVLNRRGEDWKIFRGALPRGGFTELTQISVDTFEDTGLVLDQHYKYKAAFAIQGTIGGASVSVSGKRSHSKYPVGNV